MKKIFDSPKKTAVFIVSTAVLVILAIGIIFSVIAVTRFAVGGTQITMERAKEIALADAGLVGSEVFFTKAKEEMERGTIVYELEFTTDDTDYEYEINGNTGNIYSKSKEVMGVSGTDTNRQGTVDVAGQESSEAGKGISETDLNLGDSVSEDFSENSSDIGVTQAMNIAVDHAGFAIDEVQFSKSKLEQEHGTMIYEIEFYKDGMEYEYEIDAVSGELLKFDSEWDD